MATRLYRTYDRGSHDATGSVRVVVDVLDELIDRELLCSDFPGGSLSLLDLLELAEGDALPGDQQTPVCPPSDELRSVFDVASFFGLADRLVAQQHAGLRTWNYAVAFDDGATASRPQAELETAFECYPSDCRRLFDDCRISSAGRSGAWYCEHWLLHFHDRTQPSSGDRHLGLVPSWAAEEGIGDLKDAGSDVPRWQEALDRLMRVPFCRHFLMIHRNRIHDGANRRPLLPRSQDLQRASARVLKSVLGLHLQKSV